MAADDPPGIGLSMSLPGLKVPWSVETETDTDSGLAEGLVISTEVLRSAPASPPANVHCERVVGWPGTKIFCWSFWEMTAPATTRPDLAITSIAGLSAISSPFDRVWTLAERGGTNSSAGAGGAARLRAGTDGDRGAERLHLQVARLFGRGHVDRPQAAGLQRLLWGLGGAGAADDRGPQGGGITADVGHADGGVLVG